MSHGLGSVGKSSHVRTTNFCSHGLCTCKGDKFSRKFGNAAEIVYRRTTRTNRNHIDGNCQELPSYGICNNHNSGYSGGNASPNPIERYPCYRAEARNAIWCSNMMYWLEHFDDPFCEENATRSDSILILGFLKRNGDCRSPLNQNGNDDR